MDVVIRQVLIADPRSAHHQQTADIRIEQGTLTYIGPDAGPANGATEIRGSRLVVYPGFTDVFAHLCDPGLEHKETLESGARSAAAGGYTRVLSLPNTQPTVHQKSAVEYVVQKGRMLPAQVLPLGALTKHTEGKELAEMFDMRQHGAVAFTDGLHPLQNSQVMMKALQYVKAFDGVVVQVPDEISLSKHGLMHEGIISTQLGLPGKPTLAETLLLARDIELLRYTQSRLHITGISSAESVALIRRAKADGLAITCSVTPYHLHFTDEDLQGYDTHLKVNPPVRTDADRHALRQAVLDGTIDCIASHHQPHEWDSKTCEFEYARYGMEGLESTVSAVLQALPQLSPERIAELFATNPAVIFGLPLLPIAVHQPAWLTVVDHEAPYTFTPAHLQSASANNAFLGHSFTAKPVATIIPHTTTII